MHHKSFKREFMRRKAQALDSSTGVEPFITTSATRADAPYLPDCNPMEFDSVMEVPARLLNDSPSGTAVHVELLAFDAEPAVPSFEHRLLQRSLIDYGTPTIAVSFYEVTSPTIEA